MRTSTHYITTPDKNRFLGLIVYEKDNNTRVLRIVGSAVLENGKLISDLNDLPVRTTLNRVKKIAMYAPIRYVVDEKIQIFPFDKVNEEVELEGEDGKLFIDYCIQQDMSTGKSEIISIRAYQMEEDVKTWYLLNAIDTDIVRDRLKVFAVDVELDMFPPLVICDPVEKVLYVEIGHNGYIGSFHGRKLETITRAFAVWPEFMCKLTGTITRGSHTPGAQGGFYGKLYTGLVNHLDDWTPGLYKLYRVMDDRVEISRIAERIEVIEEEE